ncbi:MAG TPA: CDP-archaeol synthase [Kofleriaceae bacterium]|jgi:CDP-diacylglycerol--serine O-phosphatidyltransferase|nr:CDP-archaeol synthase [Kofleriaceae bacterium]
MDDLGRALWLALPVILGGLTHVAVIRAGWFAGLAVPLDGGLTVRSRRLLGDNKTARGALVMIAATSAWTAAQWLLHRAGVAPWSWHPLHPSGIALWRFGPLMGAGYILGELPNSALKRQLDIAPGAPAPGPRRALFWVLDQIDSFAGVVALLCLVWCPPAAVVLWLLAICLVVHPAVAALMVLVGLKSRVG